MNAIHIPFDGEIVYVQGKEFVATNVRIETLADGRRAVRFTGVCTESERNDDIRHTGYNGGTYGWAISNPNAGTVQPFPKGRWS